MKLWDIFKQSSATIFDYARGILKHTPERQKDIADLRKRLEREGVELPPERTAIDADSNKG